MVLWLRLPSLALDELLIVLRLITPPRTQFFYQLEQAGIVSPTSVDGSGTFYNIIRHRYTPTPGPNLPASGIPGGKSLIVTPHWIERGIFLAYNRIYTAAMDYAPRP